MQIEQVTQFGGRYNGAMMPSHIITCVSDPGEQTLEKLNAGDVFVYLFRRFGYPRFGWDDDKNLVSYYLTTPMDGVVLNVMPDVTGAGTFGYMLREDLYKSCSEENILPYKEWQFKRDAWALREHKIEIIEWFEKDIDKLNRVGSKWAADKEDSDFKDQDDVDQSFLNDQEAIRLKCVNEYKEIEPFPKKIPIKDRDDSSITKQCYTALCDTIEDLKRPVYVRDVQINISGRLKDISVDYDAIQYSNMAGIGVGDKLDTNPEQGED